MWRAARHAMLRKANSARGRMVSADEMDREVNRLYWKTTEPVTRLAAQLEVSRGTFYNHLRPLPADATCSACGGALLFRTRSSRDSSDAHCGKCGADEHLAGGSAPAGARSGASTRAAAGKRAAAGNRSAAKNRSAASSGSASGSRKPRAPKESERDAPAGPADSASRVASRVATAALPGWLEEDERRTQLIILAVGTAALGLGILYYSRHRS